MKKRVINRYPKYGERVRVYVDPLEPAARAVIRFNGTVARVSGTAKGPTFTLEGCESRFGVPFWFVREWLTIVGE